MFGMHLYFPEVTLVYRTTVKSLIFLTLNFEPKLLEFHLFFNCAKTVVLGNILLYFGTHLQVGKGHVIIKLEPNRICY